MPADRSVEARLLLGTLLRQARLRARISTAAAAAAISGSHSKVSRLESGQLPARRNDVETLAGLYELPPGERADLLRLAAESGGRTWWDAGGEAGISSEQVRDDLLLESAAEVIFLYDPQCVTGLLQTQGYLNALNAESWPARPGLGIQATRRRSQLMWAPGAPWVWAVFSVSVLCRAPNGDLSALREQAGYLARMVESGAALIQLLPDDSSAHMHAAGQFELLRFRPAAVGDVILVELLDGIRTVRDLRAGERYRRVFETLAAAAYHPAESARMLARAARGRPTG